MAELKYSEMNEIVIKTCLDCGYTKRLPYKKFECPSCGQMALGFFTSFEHLVGYIDKYGLGKLNITEEDLRFELIKAFQ